jgi:hypothetical protein
MKQRGFLAGIQLYAALGVVVLIAGLSVAAWGYRHKAAAAEARVHEVVGQRDRAIAAAKANEEAARRLAQLNEALNAAIVERDKRARALEEARRKIARELDEIKSTLPVEDQGCLSRDLPPPLADLLRGGPGNQPDDRGAASPGGAAGAVPRPGT